MDLISQENMRQYIQVQRLEVSHMDIQLTADRIFLAGGYTDMRKSIDGLAAVVSQRFELDPFKPSLFLFCGRRRDRVKALLWQGDGFILLYKRIESGRFQWPRESASMIELSDQQYRWLMEGLSIIQPKAVKVIHPRCCV